jgi:hypothetical protein
MKPASFCHVEIAAVDPAACEKFYTTVFGWEFLPDATPEYRLFRNSANMGGGIWKAPTVQPHGGVLVYLMVDDIEATLSEVEKHGGLRLTEKTPVAGYGWYAHFTDPAGNKMGLFTADMPG